MSPCVFLLLSFTLPPNKAHTGLPVSLCFLLAAGSGSQNQLTTRLQCALTSLVQRLGSVNKMLTGLQHHISLAVHHLVSQAPLTDHIKLPQTRLHAQLPSALFGLGFRTLYLSPTNFILSRFSPANRLIIWICGFCHAVYSLSLPTSSSINLLSVPSPLQLSH